LIFENNNNFRVGKKIKKLRKAQGLTQEQLAYKANISPNYVSLIETNQREPSLDIYRCIANALHIPMWQLFYDLPEGVLLILEELQDCSDIELMALRRFIASNKDALRQHHRLDLDK